MVEAHSAIANFLRSRREAAGLTRAELARRAGVSEALIQKVEQGIRQPTATALGALFGALDVPPPYRERTAGALLPELAGLYDGGAAPKPAELSFLNSLPCPACYQTTPGYDLVAINDAHRRWFPGLEPGDNVLEWMLLDPVAVDIMGDRWRDLRTMVYAFRHMAPGPVSPERIEEIAVRCRRSPDWEQLWSGPPPEGLPARTTRIRSPETGELTVMNVQLFRRDVPRRESLLYTLSPARPAE
ncbi:helix-turn-helix domain-containing protein [Nocardia sp. NBC_01388]|uniref:helix-turn-helix domain-containing protein n=1 Tax=Nocardia sp. NBC_01388 TaxID=2903596 RepID=UPI00324E8BCE